MRKKEEKGFVPYVGIMFLPYRDLEGSMYPLTLKEGDRINVDLL